MEIQGVQINESQPPYIIAEISCNHVYKTQGDWGPAGKSYERCEQLLRLAAEAGCHAVKLQTYLPNTITMESEKPPFQIKGAAIEQWNDQTLFDLYEENYTPWEWTPKLMKVANELGVTLFTSPFDETAVDFLEECGVPAYKIASFESTDHGLLRKVASTGKPIILSTGMSSEEDIDESITVLREAGATQIAVLRCTSAYPAKHSDAHISAIPYIAKKWNVVSGLSDHTTGISIALGAVALGARIIEKHIVLDPTHPTADAPFSMTPQQFKELVIQSRMIHSALGHPNKAFLPKEGETFCKQYRRSLFVVKDIKKGETFIEGVNVRSIRPSNGLHTRFLPDIIGKTAYMDIERCTPLTWNHVSPMICIVATASQQKGMGHFIRCKALVHSLKERGNLIHWYLDVEDETSRQIISEQLRDSHDFIEQPANWNNLDFKRFDTVFIDSYDPDEQTVKHISAQTKTVILDDHQYRNYANIRICPLQQEEYRETSLVGTEYLMLRPEFTNVRACVRENWFICFGCADTTNITRKCLIYLLENIKDIKTVPKLIIVATNEIIRAQELQQLIEQWPSASALKSNVSASEMAQIMNTSTRAIVSSSGVAIEALAMKCPIVAMELVDNHSRHAAYLRENNVPVEIDIEKAVDLFLQNKSTVGSTNIDGHGTQRVADKIQKLNYNRQGMKRKRIVFPKVKILFLGLATSVFKFLQDEGHHIDRKEDELTPSNMYSTMYDIVISHKYRHLIKPDTIKMFDGRIINLHASFLPFNRGADPNLWSHLEKTQCGITIHHVSKGLDTGNIIKRKKIDFDENMTLRESYNLLDKLMCETFKLTFQEFCETGYITYGRPQCELNKGNYTVHRSEEKNAFFNSWSKGWDTTISESRKLYAQWLYTKGYHDTKK